MDANRQLKSMDDGRRTRPVAPVPHKARGPHFGASLLAPLNATSAVPSQTSISHPPRVELELEACDRACENRAPARTNRMDGRRARRTTTTTRARAVRVTDD